MHTSSMPLHIVIPMAGYGARFSTSGYEIPKPLLEVSPGVYMIDWVIRYLTVKEPHQFIFVCREDHVSSFDLHRFFAQRVKNFKIVTTKRVTRGPACTALLARPYIQDRQELLVAYCDDYLDIHIPSELKKWRSRRADGGALIFPSSSPSLSYAMCNRSGEVLRTAEKKVISRWATAGLYYFREGKIFVRCAQKMIKRKALAKGEFFVCPVFNELIAAKKRVFATKIPTSAYHPMGTPKTLAKFIRSNLPFCPK